MKIFLDTADINEIEKAKGIISGVTTNPSLMNSIVESLKKEGKDIDLEGYIKKILKSVNGPVSLEVKSVYYESMVAEAEQLYKKYNKINHNVVIKIPVSTFTGDTSAGYFEGLKAINQLKWKIPTNATLVMTVSQAVLAAEAGAKYVSPFVGRVDDCLKKKFCIDEGRDTYLDEGLVKKITDKLVENIINRSLNELRSVDFRIDSAYKAAKELKSCSHDDGVYSGVDLVKKIIQVYKQYSFETKIIAASIRNKRQVEALAIAGVDIVTVPYNVLLNLEIHSETIKGVNKFRKDAAGLIY